MRGAVVGVWRGVGDVALVDVEDVPLGEVGLLVELKHEAEHINEGAACDGGTECDDEWGKGRGEGERQEGRGDGGREGGEKEKTGWGRGKGKTRMRKG